NVLMSPALDTPLPDNGATAPSSSCMRPSLSFCGQWLKGVPVSESILPYDVTLLAMGVSALEASDSFFSFMFLSARCVTSAYSSLVSTVDFRYSVSVHDVVSLTCGIKYWTS